MTKKQPILDELHAVREKLLADAGGTLAGLVARLQAEQAASGRTILKTRRTSQGAEAAKLADVPIESQLSPTGDR
ncbi:MAG: hypothetical protein U1A77_17470 [Pirellulales bacterium]